MSSLLHFWKNTSISNKLYVILGAMVLLISLELLTLLFAMNSLIAIRVLVTGESLWSKAQKNAVISLLQYGRTQNPLFYQKFSEYVGVTLGDHNARLALIKETPDFIQATTGFLQGQTHPHDVDSVMYFLARFKNESHVKKSLAIWTDGDELIQKIISLGEQLHQEITSRHSSQRIAELIAQTDMLNENLSKLENDFSNSLGDGARWLERVLLLTLFFAVIAVEGTGIALIIFLSRYITRALKELNTVANRIGQGDYALTVPVRSRDELGRLAWSLNRMSQNLEQSVEKRIRAEQSSKTKSQFLANMSHEIRTPLSAIIGFTDLLKDSDLSEEQRQSYLAIIQRTGESLSTLINDILDLSKVEAGHMEISEIEFSLHLLISEIQALIGNLAARKNLSVIFETIGELPEYILSDPFRLRQILMNILNNAVKFTDHGQIKMICQRNDSQLIFTIKDTGIGIPSQEKEILFKPFSQIDSSLSRKNEGTGLGLVLSRKLAELLGGTVILKDNGQESGSTFVVSIALHEPHDQKNHASFAADSEADLELLKRKVKDCRVLLVDDVEDNLLLIKHFLKRYDMQIDVANNGQEALKKVGIMDYDIILMDIQMPIMDGHTAAKELRTLGHKMPIIALTAHAMKEDREKSLAAGCNDYLTKPIKADILARTISKYF